MPARAATQWNDFPPERSRLTFDAPGLNSRPTKAQEGIVLGGKTNVRHFAYYYAAKGNSSYAVVMVHTINADGTYFTAWPDFDADLPHRYGDFKNKLVTWDDAEAQRADAPVGPTKYRRLMAGGRSCLVFGGLYGAAATAPFAAGYMASGSVVMHGFYCAPSDYRLSPADALLVLSRLGFEDLAKPQGPRPPAFSGSDEAAPAETAPAIAKADVPPAPQPSPAVVPAAESPGAGEVRRAVALVWEGHAGPIEASMVFNPHAATARLTVFLPGEARACIGIAHTAKDNTGEWSVQCPSGAHAGGRFRFLGQKQGSMGEGRDNTGAKVAFTVAGE